MKRENYVDAAKDLNTVLDPDPPIDVSKGVEDLKSAIKEAIPELTESDELEENTKKVIAELTGTPKEEPKAKATKEKTAKAKKDPGAGRKTRMTEEDILKIVRAEMPAEVKEFSKGAADKLLKRLRDRDDFACSRERFHPIFEKALTKEKKAA